MKTTQKQSKLQRSAGQKSLQHPWALTIISIAFIIVAKWENLSI